MKSKVKKVTGNGTYDSKYGLLYKFEYEFEDGVVLNANHKKQDGNFKSGEEVEYEIKGTNDYGSWGSVSKPEEQQHSKDDYVKGVEIGHAINNAVNMICAGVELNIEVPTGTNEEKIYLYAKSIMAIANRLKNEI